MKTKNVLISAAMVLFACGAGLSFLDKFGGATLTYGGAVFCLIFAFLPEFKSFKGLGVKAELKEHLEVLNAGEDALEREQEFLQREVAELTKSGGNKTQELKRANDKILHLEQQLRRLVEVRSIVAEELSSSTAESLGIRDPLEAEALRKLRLWVMDEELGKPGTEIQPDLWGSDTYGVTGFTQVQQNIMERREWIKLTPDKDILITEKGRKAVGK